MILCQLFFVYKWKFWYIKSDIIDVLWCDEKRWNLDTDLEFYVNGWGACFLSSICVVGYDYEGRQFDTIDEAMEAKVFDGKSLVDVWDEEVFQQIKI